MDSFRVCNIRTVDNDEYDPKQLFAEFDHFEEYVPESFVVDDFIADYGQGLTHYRWFLFEVRSPNTKNYFMAAAIHLNDKELTIYREHCQCDYCRLGIFSFTRLFHDSMYYSCLNTQFANLFVDTIRKTRAFLLNNHLPTVVDSTRI